MVEPAPKGALIAVRERREAVIELLCDGYATDLLPEEEFERRLDLAHRTSELAVLDDIVRDIEVANAPSQAPSTALAPLPEAVALDSSQRAKSKNVVAILGGVTRKGTWRVPKKLRAFTILGGVELDFREVALPPGPTDVQVYTILGGTDIIVPPGVAVECEGVALLGGFETLERAPTVPSPSDPVIRISGVAILGGVDVQTRLPGESQRQAKKRRKAELKAEAKARKLLNG